MQTIPDSNIVLDVISGPSVFRDWSSKKLEGCARNGKLITNAVVFSESSAQFAVWRDAAMIFDELQLIFEDIPKDVAHLAGCVHAQYRKNGGTRDRVLPDFLIGAHAAVNNYCILTRDRKRYRTYFPTVEIIAPDTHP